MIRSLELVINRDLRTIAFRLAATNPFRNGLCIHCRPASPHKHTTTCVWELATRTRDTIASESDEARTAIDEIVKRGPVVCVSCGRPATTLDASSMPSCDGCAGGDPR